MRMRFFRAKVRIRSVTCGWTLAECCLTALLENQIAQPVGIIGTVCQHHRACVDIAQQLGSILDFIGLARCDDRLHRQASLLSWVEGYMDFYFYVTKIYCWES